MVSEWITYRTRFLICAQQLDEPLTFVDCIGREHSGQRGDYLVLSSDGSKRIAPREIFEDIYVPMDQPAELMEGAGHQLNSAPSEFDLGPCASQSPVSPRFHNAHAAARSADRTFVASLHDINLKTAAQGVAAHAVASRGEAGNRSERGKSNESQGADQLNHWS